jgi:hypothetical protein
MPVDTLPLFPAAVVLVEGVLGCGKHALTPVALEYVPATQSMQVLTPVALEYLPATQSMQVLA